MHKQQLEGEVLKMGNYFGRKPGEMRGKFYGSAALLFSATLQKNVYYYFFAR
jgi:hypothetical protein